MHRLRKKCSYNRHIGSWGVEISTIILPGNLLVGKEYKTLSFLSLRSLGTSK